MPISRPSTTRTILAADVGGTHARVGIVRAASMAPRNLELRFYASFECARFPGLDAILHAFLADHGEVAIDGVVVACAGYLDDDRIVNSNLAWPVERTTLVRALGDRDLALINDFEALACALTMPEADDAPLIGGQLAVVDAPELVIGPGTGLGAAVRLPGSDGQCRILHTEAGQVSLAPSLPIEIRVLERLLATHAHVNAESILSGPGLHTLYTLLAAQRGADAVLDSPAAVSHAAQVAHDPLAIEALEVFCGLLGSYVGDLVLLYGARGGVYLAGGVLSHISAFLTQSTFHERMVAKGVMRPILERVPVRMLETGHLGVLGATFWYLQHRTKSDGATTSDPDLIAPLHATQR